MAQTIRNFFVFLVLLLTTMVGAKAQENLVFIKKQGDFFDVDPIGNVYVIDGNTLYKINSKNEILAQYSNRSLGNISSISVENSMKIFLFYKDSGMLVFLDDDLAEIGSSISLFEKNLYNITLASFSTQNIIRLYDISNNELIFLDLYGNEISRSNHSFSLHSPIKILELDKNNFAIQDGEQGLFFFDNFGSFSKQVQFTTKQPLFNQQYLFYYTENGMLKGYDVVKLEKIEKKMKVSEKQKVYLYLQKGFVFGE